MEKKFGGNFGWYIFLSLLLLILAVMFRPVWMQGKIPLSANLLVSFYNPWAVETFPGWENGIPNKPMGGDDILIFYPQRSFTTEMLMKGEIPFWNPYNFSGNYHLGLSETAVFYPLSLIFLFMSEINAWIVLVIIEPILIAVGMYLYLRLLLKDIRAVIFASLSFAFSDVVIVRMVEGLSVGQTLLWMPFVFYGIEGFLQKKQSRYLFVILFSLVCSLLAGWFQFTFYIISFSALYAVFRVLFHDDSRQKWQFFVILPYLVLPFVSLFHLLPALATLSDSPRSMNGTVVLAKYLMPLQHLWTYIFPDFWGNPGSYNYFGKEAFKESVLSLGIIPFVFAVFSLILFKSDRIVRFFSLATFVALVLGINNPISRLVIQLPLPIISSFLPDRIFLIASFSLSILSGFGFSYVLSHYNALKIKQYIWAFAAIIFISILADIYLFAAILITNILSHMQQTSIHDMQLFKFLQVVQSLLFQIGLITNKLQLSIQLKNIILPQVLLFFCLFIFLLKKKMNSHIFFSLLLMMAIFSQIYFAQKYLIFSERSFVFPSHPVFNYLQNNMAQDRFISVGEGYISSDFPLVFRLFSPDGVSSMYITRYAELIQFMQSKGSFLGSVSRIETRIEPPSNDLFIKKDPYLLRFMQIDGVKYIVKLKNEKDSTATIRATSTFPLVWQDKHWQIYTYRDALPRFFWTNKYEVIHDKMNLLTRLFAGTFHPNTILLEKNPKLTIPDKGVGSVKLLRYSPNTVILNSIAATNGLVFLSDNYSPSFSVTVDGKPEELLRADYTFRAVAVPAGKHIIIMSFNKGEVYNGLLLAVIIWAGLIISAYLLRKKILPL